MEQTSLHTFFTARKNSSSLPPTKRRKLDNVTRAPIRRSSRTGAKTIRRKTEVDSNLDDVFASNDSPEQGANRKISKGVAVSANNAAEKDVISTVSIIKENEGSTASLSPAKVASQTTANEDLPRNEWISDQAKAVFHRKREDKFKKTLSKSQHPSELKRNMQTNASDVKTSEQSTRAVIGHPVTLAKNFPGKPKKTLLKALSSNEDTTSSSRVNDVPAYKRYESLAVKAPTPSLPLPRKYQLLLDQFRCADSVLYLLQQRSEVCTFKKLRQSVQRMSSRNFDLKHLAMMKTVYPKAFTLQYEKGLRDLAGHKQSTYQLTVEANFSDVLSRATSAEGKSKVPPSALLTRKDVFHSRLISIVKTQHKEFLDELGMVVPDEKLCRWHPNFKLDDTSDIEEATLPMSPATASYSTAKDVLEKTNGTINPRIKEALETIVTRQSKEIIAPAPATEDPTKTPSSKSMLNQVSGDLLERIRQKERRKHEIEMQRNPEQEKHLGMVDRLPEISRILKTFFTSERRSAIPLDDCLQKLLDSYGTAISTAELEEHVQLLAKECPEWLTIVRVRKCAYVKQCKGTDINMVLQKIKILSAESKT